MTAPKIALCLSGGGFRATLFHLGALRRLNELGLLAGLDVVTSVSGGSVLNGYLAAGWDRLRLRPDNVFDNLADVVEKPVLAFCGTDLRTPLLIGQRLNPINVGVLVRDWFSVRANFLAAAYRRGLPQRLADLAAPGTVPPGGAPTPRFVFVATNVATGVSWQFHAGPAARMGDFHAGYWPVADTGLADAVAASSAFPPGFSGLRLKVPARPAGDDGRTDPWGKHRDPSALRLGQKHVGTRGQVVLTDGGVYDNLGLEPVWERGHWLLLSDAGRAFQSDPDASQWLVGRLARAADIAMEQAGALRKRWVWDRKKWADEVAKSDPLRAWSAAMWLLSDAPTHAHAPPVEVRRRLNTVRTDLNVFEPGEAGCLMNAGYVNADAAVVGQWGGAVPNRAAAFAWPAPAVAAPAAAEAALKDSGGRSVVRDVWAYLRGR